MTDDVFLKPPVHGRIVNWLGPQMVERLLEFAQSQRDGFRDSRVWNNAEHKSQLDPRKRHSWQIRELGVLGAEIQERSHALLPDMCRRLGNTPFEPSQFEMQLVAHGDGAFYTEHRDRQFHSPLASRRISAVYYFHRLPKSFSGGALRIYPIAGSNKSTSFVEIEPANDTIVFFPSWFPHEVLPVTCPSRQFEDSRFAINCWVHG